MVGPLGKVDAMQIECSLVESKNIPVIVSPKSNAVDVGSWVRDNTPWVDEQLLRNGAMLFRGFDLRSEADFDAFVPALWSETMVYLEGATPRTKLTDRIYTSTEFGPSHTIALHNELSYVITFPRRIAFFCETPAQTGGETPIADVRKVWQKIPKTLRDSFVEKGWMLTRNFEDGFGPTWESSFHVSDRAAAERYFDAAQVQYQWKPGGRLRTRQVRPAFIRHPKTQEELWFNHVVFWHISSLDPEIREPLLEEFELDDLPYNTYYGDGTDIAPETISTIRHVLDQETVTFPWQAGDVLLLDNMLVAHGRNPYTGSRRVLAAMGDPFSRRDVETSNHFSKPVAV
jgi:alpha-ketoglutarate-dependent taurine dioxygenase